MKRLRLFWQVFPAFVAASLAVLLVVYLSGRRLVEDLYWQESRAALESNARFFAELAREPLERSDAAALDALAKRLGQTSGVRITVVAASGRVLADSSAAPGCMDDHRGRREIAAALRTGQVAWSDRASPTLGEEFLYVAYPVLQDGRPATVVRASKTTAELVAVVVARQRQLLWTAAISTVVLLALSWLVVRRIARPLERMRSAAGRFGRGDLGHVLPVAGSRETADLAEAMNAMAGELRAQIAQAVSQRNELDAVLQSMAEGVLTLDAQGRVLDLNAAGERMFQLEAPKVRGRFIQEVLRRPPLLNFIEKVLQEPHPRQEELVFYEAEPRFFVANGSTIRSADAARAGVLIVLSELTRLRQLENLRRDFVANASHELRTPLASMKAAVETLLAGGLDDPAAARRFLGMLLEQTNRLAAIVDDVLSLARIEKDVETHQMVLEPIDVAGVLQAALQATADRARAAGVSLRLECPAEIVVRAHGGLMQQAVVNLIDNAVKYSPAGGEVAITAVRRDGGVRITVADRGPGIEPRYQHRLFERFFRVDASRSRETGGTGLGLSIVKQVALAHGGWVGLESKPGEGSRFHIDLPG